MTSAASMVNASVSRTFGLSGLNQFVNQHVYCQPSHTASHSTSDCSAPSGVSEASSVCDTCVMAKT